MIGGTSEGASVKWVQFPVWEDKNCLEMSGGDGCTIMWMYLMLQTVHLKNGWHGKFSVVFTTIKSKNLKKTKIQLEMTKKFKNVYLKTLLLFSQYSIF